MFKRLFLCSVSREETNAPGTVTQGGVSGHLDVLLELGRQVDKRERGIYAEELR